MTAQASFHPQRKARLKIKVGPSYVQQPLTISLVITIILLLLIVAVQPAIQPHIPLFYSLPNPEQQLAPKAWLFLLPTLSTIINCIHIGAIYLFKEADELMIRLYAWGDLIVQIILLIITLRNILVVLSL